MKLITQFENKKVLVLGLAKSGEAAARLLANLKKTHQHRRFLKKELRLSVVDILLNFWMKILN